MPHTVPCSWETDPSGVDIVGNFSGNNLGDCQDGTWCGGIYNPFQNLPFFGGGFSGIWSADSANGLNAWQSQQFWLNTVPFDERGDTNFAAWEFLPQNQNPKGQSGITLFLYQLGPVTGQQPNAPQSPIFGQQQLWKSDASAMSPQNGYSAAPSCPTAPASGYAACELLPSASQQAACVKNLNKISKCQTLPSL